MHKRGCRFLKTQPSALRRRRRRSVGEVALSLASVLREEDKPRGRARRELSEWLESVLGGVKQQLHGLEMQQQQHNDSAVSDPGLAPQQASGEVGKCRVAASGRVNCSRAVYRDSKVWRRSKQHIDQQINRLREQLEALKEIRRHLRHKRPPPGTTREEEREEEEEEEGENGSEEEEDEEEEEDSSEDPEDLEEPGDEVTETLEPQTSPAPRLDVWSTLVTAAPSSEAPSTAPPPSPAPRSTAETSPPRWSTELPPPTVSARLPPKLGTTVHQDRHGNVCICEPDPIAEARRREKEQKLRRKERKLRRKARMEQECLSEKMNCFMHDNSHWRTAPLWSDGPFCACMNANNNTYWCLRTINVTHNFLFCEFVTGLVTFYNLRIDPFEQWNRVHALSSSELESLKAQLEQMKGCRGARECRSASPPPASAATPSSLEQEQPPLDVTPHPRKRPKPGNKHGPGSEQTRLRQHRQDSSALIY